VTVKPWAVSVVFPAALRGYARGEVMSFVEMINVMMLDRSDEGHRSMDGHLTNASFDVTLFGYDRRSVDGFVSLLRTRHAERDANRGTGTDA
jgi:hypothetical protein